MITMTLTSVASICLWLLAASHFVAGSAIPDLKLTPRQNAPCNAVASESKECTEIGLDVLSKNGNAADAMVATVLCVGVIGMYHSGIGGGGFALVRQPNDNYEFVDFRETAPADVIEELYITNITDPMIGGAASGVPGELKGLFYLHKTYGSGRLSWEQLVTPAAQIALKGFTVNEDLHRYMRVATGGDCGFFCEEPWRSVFTKNGRLLEAGETITWKTYGETLTAVAKMTDINEFYQGKFAESMRRAITENEVYTENRFTLSDMRNYQILRRNISQIHYRGYKVTSTTAPSSGAVVLSMLNIIKRFTEFTPGADLLSTHRLNEAMRHGYGRRTKLGDPNFSIRDMAAYQNWMLDNSTAANTQIDDDRTHTEDFYIPNDPTRQPRRGGTSHISVIDKQGMALSLTTTINGYFGSHVMTDTGIIMNNQLGDFYIPVSAPNDQLFPENRIKGNKRPLSSISPTIITTPDGKPYFITGSAGGIQIVSAVLQSIVNVIDRGMGVSAALKAPRMHDQLIPDTSFFERPAEGVHEGYNKDIVEQMHSVKGHKVEWMYANRTVMAAIRLPLGGGEYEASGEPRQRNSLGAVQCS